MATNPIAELVEWADGLPMEDKLNLDPQRIAAQAREHSHRVFLAMGESEWGICGRLLARAI